MKTQRPARPAEEFEPLQAQLQGALYRLERGDSEPSEPWRAYLRQLMSLVWRKLAKGDLTAPRRALQALSSSHAFVEAHLPEEQLPRAEAARELHFAWKSLEMAERAAEAASLEAELRDRHRSATEREILQVLFAASGRFLRRGQIHEAMHLTGRQPSPARVSQLLNRLFEQGLLLRKSQKAKGAAEVGFYSLSEAGKKFCQEQLTEEGPVENPVFLVHSPLEEESINSTETVFLSERDIRSAYEPTAVASLFNAYKTDDTETRTSLYAEMRLSMVDFPRLQPGLLSALSPSPSHPVDELLLRAIDRLGGSRTPKPVAGGWLRRLRDWHWDHINAPRADFSVLKHIRALKAESLRAKEKESSSMGPSVVFRAWVSAVSRRSLSNEGNTSMSELARILYAEAIHVQEREPLNETVSKVLRQLETEVWRLAVSGREGSGSTLSQSYNPSRTFQNFSSGKTSTGKPKP